MTDDNSDLSPCPLCGGGETQVRTNYMPVKMGQKPEIIGVEINHWCDGLIRGAQRRSVHAHGRDRDDAIAAWDRHFASFVPLAEVEKLRAENARLRAQVAEYFREPATHPVEDGR
jgi:chromosome condensin MukBEF complex kleisin-like MukF subunit